MTTLVAADDDDTTGYPATPTVETVDYQNGTRVTIIDYQNGTQYWIYETLLLNSVEISDGPNMQDQSLLVETPTSTEESTDWIPVTQDIVLEQEVLMGFTYQLVSYHKTLVAAGDRPPDPSWGWIYFGVDIEIGFGIRLPLRVTLEYPEQMTVGHDYEIYATMTPLDLPNFDEYYCHFVTGVWGDVGVFWSRLFDFWVGPQHYGASSFQTPIGGWLPLSPTVLTIADFGAFKVDVSLWPQAYGSGVTARASAEGDAMADHGITWSYPNEKVTFMVHAEDYGPGEYAEISLSDFKYWLSAFSVSSYLGINWDEDMEFWLGLIDIWAHLATVDMGWTSYLGVHHGWPGSLDVSSFVKKFGVDLVPTQTSQDIVPGETVAYDVLGVNNGNVDDTFTLSATDLPSGWWYEFSSPQLTVGPYGSASTQLSIQPPRHWSTSPGEYPFSIYGTSLSASAEGLVIGDTEILAVNVLPFNDVDVSVSPESEDIVPGETGVYSVTVTNQGNVPDVFSLSVEGLPESWQYSIPSDVSLEPGQSSTVELSVEPWRHWSTSPGEYPFTVTGTSLGAMEGGTDVSDTEALATNVLPFYDVDTDISPESVDIVPGETGVYSVTFTNQGNVPDTFSISVDGIPSSWEYSIPEDVSLDPGQSTTVGLSVEPWRHWSTSPGEYPFTVTGMSQEAADAGQSESETAGAAVNVLPFYDISLEVTPEAITVGTSETAIYSLTIVNLGNVVDDFEISLGFADNGDECRAHPTVIQEGWASVDAYLTLEPGASETRTLAFEIPYDWAGMEDTTYGFTATVSDVHGASAQDSAEVTVTADKESMSRHVDYEIGVLASWVEASDIAEDLKESLLDKLSTASKKDGQCLDNILDIREKQADNMLKACMNVVEAFAKLAKAQKGKGIDKPLSEEWISAAGVIISDIGETMQTPL